MRPITHNGYQLLHEGTIALARVEANGIRIDEKHLRWAIDHVAEEQRRLKVELQETKMWKIWRKRFGQSAKLTSNEQLGKILFKDMGYKAKEFTDSGRPSTDVSALEKVDPNLQFLKDYVKFKQMDKAGGTFLRGIQRELCDGFIHPNFNLHLAQTYRSSSDNPNFQNFPVRNAVMAELVRRSFISRFGKKGVLVENDYKGIEVSVSACYHKDPVFISYIEDPTKDMHGDMAAQLYCLKKKWVHKNTRYGAKNMFVFPQFYGSFYAQCAPNLWEWVDRAQLPGPEGVTLRKHLDELFPKGLGACDFESRPKNGTFEKHVQEVENDFWNNRFETYGQWKRDWYKQYLDLGYFDTLTGFRIEGAMKRNEVINYPVQGAAFHVLLWSLARAQKKMKKMGMRSVIAGQIHDSIIGDVHVDELTDYLGIIHEVSTVDVRKHWDWIIVPLTVENEIVPIGEPWFYKQDCGFDMHTKTFTLKGDNGSTLFNNSQAFLSALKRKAA